MAEGYYLSTHVMPPRPGKKYSTTYYKQTQEQRRALVRHFRQAATEIANAADVEPEVVSWLKTPDKSFKRDGQARRGQSKYKTPEELMTDILAECSGTKRDGTPKDFAKAPIDRWNKLFADTKYEIDMVQQFGAKPTAYRSFDRLFDRKNTIEDQEDDDDENQE